MQNNADSNMLVRRSIHTEYFSTGWMAFEFLVGLYSGITAHSILLIAFGLDSFLEIISGSTLIWRLRNICRCHWRFTVQFSHTPGRRPKLFRHCDRHCVRYLDAFSNFAQTRFGQGSSFSCPSGRWNVQHHLCLYGCYCISRRCFNRTIRLVVG